MCEMEFKSHFGTFLLKSLFIPSEDVVELEEVSSSEPEESSESSEGEAPPAAMSGS